MDLINRMLNERLSEAKFGHGRHHAVTHSVIHHVELSLTEESGLENFWF